MQYLNNILCAFCEHLISYICQRYRGSEWNNFFGAHSNLDLQIIANFANKCKICK